MEQIKLNEKHVLPGEERYFIIEENAGILTGTLYEPDGQRIMNCQVMNKNFDEVIAIFKQASRAANKIADFINNAVKHAEVKKETSEPIFNVSLTPTDCRVHIKGKAGSIVSLLATFLHINPEYVKLFELAIKTHHEHKGDVKVLRTKGIKYEA